MFRKRLIFSGKVIGFLPLFWVCMVAVPFVEAKRYKYDVQVKMLAKGLGSGRMSSRASDAAAQSRQLAAILTVMKQVDVSNGPEAGALLSEAYSMRQEICPSLRTLCAVNIEQQFEAAEMMGLFDAQRKFSPIITKGRDLGKEILYEHIVPASICPEFSTSLANIRIVRPGEARQSGTSDADDARVVALTERFRAVLDEQKRYDESRQYEKEVDSRRFVSSDYGMGRTQEEHEQVWQGFVNENPDVLKQEPYIATEVKKTMTRVGYGTNEITATITNRAQHPTEVSVDLRMIGLDELRNKASMELGRIQGSIKLLQLQERDIELQGTTQFRIHKRKVIINNRYRGWVLTVRHAGKVISRSANPDYLLEEFPP